VSSRGFIPPPEEEALSTDEVDDGLPGDGGEPTTKDDEFARDDAPEQEFENDS
jgi:hypothetical protein